MKKSHLLSLVFIVLSSISFTQTVKPSKEITFKYLVPPAMHNYSEAKYVAFDLITNEADGIRKYILKQLHPSYKEVSKNMTSKELIFRVSESRAIQGTVSSETKTEQRKNLKGNLVTITTITKKGSYNFTVSIELLDKNNQLLRAYTKKFKKEVKSSAGNEKDAQQRYKMDLYSASGSVKRSLAHDIFKKLEDEFLNAEEQLKYTPMIIKKFKKFDYADLNNAANVQHQWMESLKSGKADLETKELVELISIYNEILSELNVDERKVRVNKKVGAVCYNNLAGIYLAAEEYQLAYDMMTKSLELKTVGKASQQITNDFKKIQSRTGFPKKLPIDILVKKDPRQLDKISNCDVLKTLDLYKRVSLTLDRTETPKQWASLKSWERGLSARLKNFENNHVKYVPCIMKMDPAKVFKVDDSYKTISLNQVNNLSMAFAVSLDASQRADKLMREVLLAGKQSKEQEQLRKDLYERAAMSQNNIASLLQNTINNKELLPEGYQYVQFFIQDGPYSDSLFRTDFFSMFPADETVDGLIKYDPSQFTKMDPCKVLGVIDLYTRLQDFIPCTRSQYRYYDGDKKVETNYSNEPQNPCFKGNLSAKQIEKIDKLMAWGNKYEKEFENNQNALDNIFLSLPSCIQEIDQNELFGVSIDHENIKASNLKSYEEMHAVMYDVIKKASLLSEKVKNKREFTNEELHLRDSLYQRITKYSGFNRVVEGKFREEHENKLFPKSIMILYAIYDGLLYEELFLWTFLYDKNKLVSEYKNNANKTPSNLCEELKINDTRQKLMILMSKDLNHRYFKKFPNGEDENNGHSEEDWKLIYAMVEEVSKDYTISFIELIKQDGKSHQVQTTALAAALDICYEIESDQKSERRYMQWTCKKNLYNNCNVSWLTQKYRFYDGISFPLFMRIQEDRIEK